MAPRFWLLLGLGVVLLAGCGGGDGGGGTPVVDPLIIGTWHLVGLSYGGSARTVEGDKTLIIGSGGHYRVDWREHGLNAFDTGTFYARNSKYQQVMATTTEPQPSQYTAGDHLKGKYQFADDTLILTHPLYFFPDVEVVETYSRGAGSGMRDKLLVGRWKLVSRTEDGVAVNVHWEKVMQITEGSRFNTQWREHGLNSSDEGIFRATDGRYSMLVTVSNYPGTLDKPYYLGPYQVDATRLTLWVEEEEGHVVEESFDRL